MDGTAPEAPPAAALALLHATAVQRSTGLACVGWRAVAVAAQALAGLCGVDTCAAGVSWLDDVPAGDDASAVEACRGWLRVVSAVAIDDGALRSTLAARLLSLAERGLDDVAPRALAGVA